MRGVARAENTTTVADAQCLNVDHIAVMSEGEWWLFIEQLVREAKKGETTLDLVEGREQDLTNHSLKSVIITYLRVTTLIGATKAKEIPCCS